MKRFISDYHKVQTSGMYSSEVQKAFIDDLMAKFYTDNPSILQLSGLADNLYKLLSNIPKKKVTSADFIGKNYPWYHEGHSSCSNFTISGPKKVSPFGFPVLNLSSIDKTINLLLTLDPSTFNAKDHLNYRYINKRNATLNYYYEYLNSINNNNNCPEWDSFIAILSELNGSQITVNIKLVPQLDYRKIAIKMTQQAQGLDIGFSIQLIGGYDDNDLYFNRRLVVTNNCIRPEGVTDISTLPLTPTYNSLVFEESQYLINQELLSKALREFKNLGSAILLMKLWLERDESNSALLKQFPYGLLMAHVCMSRKLSIGASNYQIFSSTLHFIANFKINSVYTFGSDSVTDKINTDFGKVKIDNFPVLVDCNGYNLLWRCFIGFSGLINRSKEVLTQQLSYLYDNMYSNKRLFVNKISLSIRFSYITQLYVNSNDSNKLKAYNDKYEDSTIGNYVCGLTDGELSAISARSILQLALADRLDNIDFISSDDGLMKLLVNFNTVTRKVDKGVLSSGDLANGYKKFWHGLAETRIFAGHQPFLCILPHNISQSNESPNISITRYILTSNNISTTPIINYESLYAGVDDKLQSYIIDARRSFDVIINIMFSLDEKNMPLRVSRVTLLDNASYCHTDYWVPLPVYVQLESSSAWPTDATAAKYVTTAFYLSLHKSILTHPEFKAISGKKTIIPTWNHLEIKLSDTIYNLFIDGTGSDIGKVNRFEAIKAISQREISFGPAVKLAKEWAAKNCIPDTDELIEALGIHVYCSSKPKSASCGFYSILDVLCNFDWSIYTLIVYLDGTNSKIVDKEDNQPISIRVGVDKILVPNPYLISILLPLASYTLESTFNVTDNSTNRLPVTQNNVKKDFTIILNNPYNSSSVDVKREGEFIIKSFVQTLKDKFPYLILLYNPLALDGISESVFISERDQPAVTYLQIYCKINPLCILTMSTPYLTITHNEGLTAMNIAQVISELTAAGRGIVKEIVF